jgi:hypothetical protein
MYRSSYNRKNYAILSSSGVVNCDGMGANVMVSQKVKSLRGIMVCNSGLSEISFFVVCDDIWIAK